MKVCNKCGVDKDDSDFHKRTLPSGKISLACWCKSCMKEKSTARYIQKSEHIKSVNQTWRTSNKEYYHNRFLNNREQYLSWLSEYEKQNPAAKSVRSRKRRIRASQAFVAWANVDAINSIYKEAKRLSKETGCIYHVDHVIPLQGRYVSGLHVEQNLKIIPATDNLTKGKKYEVI